MSSEKMRAEFEAWAKMHFGIDYSLAWIFSAGCYASKKMQDEWLAWEAATLAAERNLDPHGTALDMDEDRIDRIAASHGDGEHYGEVNHAKD